jgi:hypothetical protein
MSLFLKKQKEKNGCCLFLISYMQTATVKAAMYSGDKLKAIVYLV